MASDKNTDFLRFSAYSFKDMITRKMSENTKFTDQVYEGSNLAILIDLCAYLFQGMTYCLNNAASESMFQDTQIYENISRLVKLIGYNPRGFMPSSCEFTFTLTDGNYDDVTIPKYTCVDTGKVDGQGKNIYYSFVDDFTIANGTNKVKLYNGKWKLYNKIFTASGSLYETFVLDGIKSDSENSMYAAYGYIDVYVKRNEEFLKFQGLTDEIFMNTSYTFSSKVDSVSIYRNTDDDRYYSIRLNENKQYEIKFGNDNNGQKLQADDQIYVFYMESNGFDAVLNTSEATGLTFIEPAFSLGITENMLYSCMMGIDDETTIQTIKDAIASITDVSNTTTSTEAIQEEDVESIRESAPNYYKLGNRLITKDDFEYYVRNRYSDNIIDVKCHNNWDYISQFYGWLYKLGKSGERTRISTSTHNIRSADQMYYISFSKLSKYDYYYADPADQNNVYLWIKMQNNLDVWKDQLDSDLTPIKVLTSEVVFLDPIIVNFTVCAAPIERAMEYIDTQAIFDENSESYIEITVNDNSLYSNASIKSQINSIFNTYFKVSQCKLGQTVSTNNILNEIYAINGVESVKTVFSCDECDIYGNKIYQDRFIDGISLASWSSTIIDTGDDIEITTTDKTLEQFQFPSLYTTDMTNKITIIKRSFSNNGTVQY